MSRLKKIRPEFIEFIPEQLDQGVLYISRRYATAAHLCCCGCRIEVVTPLNPAKWRLIGTRGEVSLHPSVGNWSFPCKSHYWIRGNRVRWAAAMAPEIIAAVRARDRRDAAAMVPKPQSFFMRSVGIWADRIRAISAWWRS